MVKVGSFRGGLYDSAYVGMLLAMIGSLWLPLFGFYVVRSSIARDISTGVGETLSASPPLRTPMYLLGKYLSNLMVLAAMAAALALIAPVMQLLRGGESTSLDMTALWLPLVLFCLPVLTVAAAAAVVFETVPFLRGGAGNVLWFFVYPSMFLAGIPLVYGSVTAGFQADLAAQHPPGMDDEISIGLTAEPGALGQFTWSGTDVDATLAAASAGLIAASTLAAILPALWFGRFDPPSRQQRSPSNTSDVPATEAPVARAFSQVRERCRRPSVDRRSRGGCCSARCAFISEACRGGGGSHSRSLRSQPSPFPLIASAPRYCSPGCCRCCCGHVSAHSPVN